MGLRSRQRRLAGISNGDSFDAETGKHRMHSLQEHLAASKNGVDTFNLMWKSRVAFAALVLVAYEIHALVSVLSVSLLAVLLRQGSIASLLSMRHYLQTGNAAARTGSVLLTIGHVAIAVVSGQPSTVLSPLCVAYFVMASLTNWLVGSNTRAEVARARQLEKLERVFHKQ